MSVFALQNACLDCYIAKDLKASSSSSSLKTAHVLFMLQLLNSTHSLVKTCSNPSRHSVASRHSAASRHNIMSRGLSTPTSQAVQQRQGQHMRTQMLRRMI